MLMGAVVGTLGVPRLRGFNRHHILDVHRRPSARKCHKSPSPAVRIGVKEIDDAFTQRKVGSLPGDCAPYRDLTGHSRTGSTDTLRFRPIRAMSLFNLADDIHITSHL